jgi:hypothetical protein
MDPDSGGSKGGPVDPDSDPQQWFLPMDMPSSSVDFFALACLSSAVNNAHDQLT